MPRPQTQRYIANEPEITYFKPQGIPLAKLKTLVLTIDEFEAIRLKDHKGFDQSSAAKKMNVSQPTFHRIILSARKKITDALVNGKAISIKGGNYAMITERLFKCYACSHEWSEPHGTGRPNTCPKCGDTNIHRAPEDRGYARPGRGRHGRQEHVQI